MAPDPGGTYTDPVSDVADTLIDMTAMTIDYQSAGIVTVYFFS